MPQLSNQCAAAPELIISSLYTYCVSFNEEKKTRIVCHLGVGNTVLPLIPHNALILTLSLLRLSVVALIKRPFVLFSAGVPSILCDLSMFALCGYQSRGPAAAMNVHIITMSPQQWAC